MHAVLLLLLDLAVTHAAPATGCAIRSHGPRSIRVEPAGGQGFYVDVKSLEWVAHPGAKRADEVPVTVEGAVRFAGTIRKPFFRARAPLDLADGMVHLRQGALAWDLSSRGADGVGRVGDFSGGPGLHLSGLAVPCDGLTADDVANGNEEPPAGNEGLLEARHRSLVFRARPGAGAAVTLEGESPDAIALSELERRGGWLRVAAWGERFKVTGWVLRSEVQRSRLALWSTATNADYAPGVCASLPPAAPGDYLGPAALVPGATIHERADGPPWATVGEATIDATVMARRGQRWIEVRALPGIDGGCPLAHAFVDATSVRLPDAGKAPR